MRFHKKRSSVQSRTCSIELFILVKDFFCLRIFVIAGLGKKLGFHIQVFKFCKQLFLKRGIFLSGHLSGVKLCVSVCMYTICVCTYKSWVRVGYVFQEG